jgi:hypothetical protein
MNFLYEAFFLESDLLEHSRQLKEVRASAEAEIIYIGESSDVTISSYDIDKRPISDMVGSFFPGLLLKSINKDASHAEAYHVWLRNLPENSHVQTVIVTMNLRSFGPEWIHSGLEDAIQKSLVMLRRRPALINRFILSFKAYENKGSDGRKRDVEHIWKNNTLPFAERHEFSTVNDWVDHLTEEPGRLSAESLEVAKKFILTYGFAIDEKSNPRIHDFDNIVQLARERGWNLVLNLLAEDLERAEDLVGPELVRLIRNNGDLLVERYRKQGVVVVDNLEAVPSECFTDRGWATEHYAEIGSKTIARRVAERVRTFHPLQFQIPSSPSPVRTDFFQDNDGSESWGRNNSASDNEAFSGHYSSRTGRGEDFSYTLAYPMKYIPDSAKNRVEITMRVLRYERNEASLAIAFDSIGYLPHHLGLNELVPKIGTWEKLSYTFEIPEHCKNAPLIRIYIFNPTQSYTYTDDMRYLFR